MIRPRFEAVRLEYGCHSGSFELPDEARPVVVAGRNGSGKTTLLEAFLRGLYGFVRRKAEDRELLKLREPWSGRPAEIEIRLLTAEGVRIAIRRDVDSDEVVAREVEADRELFRGDANPVGARSTSRRYQELVREWIGFDSLEPYRETAWIAQGELVDTRLDDEILRAAAGTHRRVEAAQTELREAFEAMTLEPLEAGGRRKNRPRRIEELRDAEEEIARRLEAARRAREEKRPLLQRSAEARAELAEIETEIEQLEAAYRPITERRTLLAEQREAEARLSALSDALESLRTASEARQRAEGEASRAAADGPYPEDFESRLGRAGELWERRKKLEREAAAVSVPSPAPRRTLRPALAIGGALLAVGGAGAFVAGSSFAGMVLCLSGAALLAGSWLTRGRETGEAQGAERRIQRLRDEIEEIRARLEEISIGLPGPLLTPETAAAHRRAFQRQAEARDAARAAAQRLGEATDSAERLLQREGPAVADGPPVEQRIRDAREDVRTTLARLQLRLEELPDMPRLPEGVEPTVPAVEAARDERRTVRDRLRERLGQLELEARDLDRASEDVFGLERELEDMRARRAEARAETSVRKYAWELVRDAYERFRATDQERLLNFINRRLAPLSGGRLGPVEAAGDLSDARVGLDGRTVALDSPPLSFGEKHVVLLAIRLGAADFVAGDGVRHPLLVDEPFTHLDEVRSRQVWELLCRLATERQVILTTQDRLVLDHLGVRPDIDLAVRQPAARAGERSPRPDASPRDEAPERSPEPGSRSDPAPAHEGERRRGETQSAQAQLELG